MVVNLFSGTSYSVTTSTAEVSDNTNSTQHNRVILKSASNSADTLASNRSAASTSSSEEVRLTLTTSSSDSGFSTALTHKEVIKTVSQHRQALIEKQKRESTTSSDATEIEVPKLKFDFDELEIASTELTKKITELKKTGEKIKTWEQYGKAFASFADLATTIVLVGVAGTATGMTAIPLIMKFIALEKDLGNAFLTRENSNRINQDLPPAKKGTDLLEALGRTIGQWGGLSENKAACQAKYFSKCLSGALDAGATASTVYAPVLSGTLKNINWYTSIGRVAVNWFIGTVLAKGEAKKEEAKYMEEVLKVIVAHQKIMLDIKSAETEQNHAETVEKLNEAQRVLGETQIVVDEKTVTIADLITQLTAAEQYLTDSQTQCKTNEERLADAIKKIAELESFAEIQKKQLAENRDKLMEQQALNFHLQRKVTRSNNGFIYGYTPSPETDLRQRRHSTID